MAPSVDSRKVVLHAGPPEGYFSNLILEVELRIESLTVRSVASGDAATELLSELSVDGLLLQQELADGPGLELLGDIREQYPELPVLFVTEDESLLEAAIEDGATDVWSPPAETSGAVVLGRRLVNLLSARAHHSDTFPGADSVGHTENTAREDGELQQTVDFLRRLYDITTDVSLSHDEKISRLIECGCESLGLSVGFLARVELDEATDSGTLTVVESVGDHSQIEPGRSLPLSETYCQQTIESDGLVAIEVQEGADRSEDPAHQRFGLDSYIGGKVFVEDDLYGTLCFASSDSTDAPISERHRTSVSLMTKWIGYELERKRSETELELKNRAMDEAPVGMTISDATAEDNPIVYANEQFTGLTGYRYSEIEGRNCRFLQGEDSDPASIEALRSSIDDQEPVTVELRNYRKDGTLFWNRVTVAPIADETGAVTNYVGFQEDVTERKEREHELKLRNRAMSEAPVGISIHDATSDGWPISYTNDRFTELTGYDHGELFGSELTRLTGEETDNEALLSIEDAFDSGESRSQVLLCYRADDTPFWGRVSVAPVTDEEGGVTHVVSFLQDVTETKNHAETIERRLDEFGDLLASELRAPLEHAKDSLSDCEDTTEIEDARRSIEQAEKLVDDLATVHSFSVKSREVLTELPGGES